MPEWILGAPRREINEQEEQTDIWGDSAAKISLEILQLCLGRSRTNQVQLS